ncbi:unnamed protein product, partial [Cuscuta epithymum]
MRLRKAQDDEALRKLVVKNTEAIRKMAELEESLRKATEGMEQKLKAAEAKGRAAAEASAAEAAKTAAIKAEEAQREAVLQAREEAISAFVADGWKVEDRRPWVDSVVEASVDAWVGGPGAMWLARKGKEYYDGGEFFTQWLVYRRLARHSGVDPKDFN